jgi:hypothetical protein
MVAADALQHSFAADLRRMDELWRGTSGGLAVESRRGARPYGPIEAAATLDRQAQALLASMATFAPAPLFATFAGGAAPDHHPFAGLVVPAAA